jgi:hypothetical protein
VSYLEELIYKHKTNQSPIKEKPFDKSHINDFYDEDYVKIREERSNGFSLIGD